jgi:hypothetical protein
MSRGERLLDQRNAGGASGAEDAQFYRSPPNEAAAVPTLLLAWPACGRARRAPNSRSLQR